MEGKIKGLSHLLGLSGHWQEELELRGQLVLGVQSIGEVNSSNSAVGMDLHSQGLNVVGSVSSTGEVGEVELDLVPALVQSHGHSTDERLHAGRALVVRGSESPAHVLVVEHLHFEGEVLFQLNLNIKSSNLRF